MKTCVAYAAMVLVQLFYGASNILIKIALSKGLNPLVFVVYRHIIAMFLLGPFAYALEKTLRPSMSIPILVKIFCLATLGTTIHLNVYYAGLAYTSPTVASALSNVVPSLTFPLALLFGMEKVKMKSSRGQAKVLGALICVGGSLTFTFWKGGYLLKALVESPLINFYGTKGPIKEDWVKGAALILVSNIAWSAWLILQAMVCKIYPAPLSMNTMICFFASLQSSFLALFFARNPNMWKLEWNEQLLTTIYCGVVNSALVYYLQTWCISNEGPVFAAMFSPLLLVIVSVFSAFVFAERIHISSLIGAFLIVVGLYCVLWGKRLDSPADGTQENGVGGLPDSKFVNISVSDTNNPAQVK